MSDETPTSPTLPVRDDGLLEAVNQLGKDVRNLTSGLTVQSSVHRRWRILSGVVTLVIVVVLSVGFANNQRIADNVEANKATQVQIADNVEANKATQVQQCENANSVREANVSIWSTVLGLTAVNADLKTQAALAALLEWITKVYEQRDCRDLDRVYTAPPPPDLSQFFLPPEENAPE